MNIKPLFLFFLLFAYGFSSSFAQAADSPIIIRDTEIEHIIKEWSEGVIKAADLNPASVHFILVQSDEVNAFVAGGENVFIYTGLIEKTETPEELIGVIAHELGHIRGGHLIRTREAMRNASYEALLGTLLGIGAALATGEGGAAAAVSAGTHSMAQRSFLKHSRIHESSADQAALSYLEKAKQSPDGFLSFMGKLASEELLSTTNQSEYVRTHPLGQNRMNVLRRRAEQSPYAGKASPSKWKEQHARMKAKLIAFISPGRVLWEYKDNDQSVAARYAHAIADYRQNKIQGALREIDALIAREKDNPYFYELKGQMLMEFGRVKDSIAPYERAVSLLPDAPLLRVALAHSLIESAWKIDKSVLYKAIKHLNYALDKEPNSTRIHRFLAISYGRLGDEGKAKLHLAEEAFLQRKIKNAKALAEKALAMLDKNSAEWLRANDLLHYIELEHK